MRLTRRSLSRREREIIDGFITDICREMGLPGKDADLRTCAWEAFLSVYRDAPGSFSGDGLRGWRRAYSILWQELKKEKQKMYFWQQGRLSLDQPVSEEVQQPLVELLRAPHGDFQNGVCLYDYLWRMDPDESRMAFQLMRGDSLEEIQTFYHWSPAYAFLLRNRLRDAMEAYLAI